jgi:hypothetical protein
MPRDYWTENAGSRFSDRKGVVHDMTGRKISDRRNGGTMGKLQLAVQLATTSFSSIAFAATEHLQWKKLPHYGVTATATDPHRTMRK